MKATATSDGSGNVLRPDSVQYKWSYDGIRACIVVGQGYGACLGKGAWSDLFQAGFAGFGNGRPVGFGLRTWSTFSFPTGIWITILLQWSSGFAVEQGMLAARETTLTANLRGGAEVVALPRSRR